MVISPRAVLLDVYRTVVAVDFAAVGRCVADAAGVDSDALRDALGPSMENIGIGALSMVEALDQGLRACGATRATADIEQLVQIDAEAMCATAVVYDDVVPFLLTLRERGVASAFVSNCAENTRVLLDRLGLTALVDDVVLSCEVGSAKPSREIFDAALVSLGVEPADALLIDDQAEYCEGAMSLGIRAVQLLRPEVRAVSAKRISQTATSLRDIAFR